MIIVVEGPDGTGKTELAREFERRGFTYVHNGPPLAGEDLFATYTDQLLAAGVKNFIFDRLHVGALIYGQIIRGGLDAFSFEQLRLINRLLFGRGGLLIFGTAPPEVAKNNWLRRKEKEYVDNDEKFNMICRAYRQIQSDFLFQNTVAYDFTRWRDKIPAFVDETLLRFPYVRPLPDGVIGSPNATYVFVGERPGGARDLAFYSDKKSSGFLNRCLWEAGYPEHAIAFTNAYARDGTIRDLRRIYNSRRSRVFVALGRVAQRACTAQGVPHLSLEHPQFIKRFRSAKRKKYVDQLFAFRKEPT